MNQQQITVKQCIQISAGELGKVQLPVEMIDSVGAQLVGIRRNLMLCIEALEKAEQENAEKARDGGNIREIFPKDIEPEENKNVEG